MPCLNHTSPAPSTTRDIGGRAAPGSTGVSTGVSTGLRTGLRVDGVSVLRGERLVLRGVSFAVAPGGAALVTGPNGAGKTTLLRVLAGLVRPDAGRVTWDGADGVTVGWLGPLDAVKPGLTAAENLRFAARLSGRTVPEALAAMGLEALAALPARLLSTGQRRRLALARLFLSPAPLWLLDEPTLGLDTASVGRLGAMLAAHRAGGGAVVTATHGDLPLPGAEPVRL